jgi:hypothetical protein
MLTGLKLIKQPKHAVHRKSLGHRQLAKRTITSEERPLPRFGQGERKRIWRR